MIDTRAIKPEDNKGGTFTQQLTIAETTTAYVSPVPSQAPGVITAEPGTVNEEAIYFKSKDAGAGTISGLIRDYTNLNGGVGIQHENGEDWEVFQSAFYVTNILDILIEGFIREQQTTTYVSTSSFTVMGNHAIIYTEGRVIRIDGDNNLIGSVVSSSYSAGTGLTTVTVQDVTVPNPITYVEFGVQPKNTPAAVFPDATQTLTNKTLTSPTLTTPVLSGDMNMGTSDNLQVNGADPWRTITLMPGFLKPTTTAGCGLSEKIEAGTNDIDYDVMPFDASSDENAFANFPMPDSWDGGVIQFRYFWTNAAGLTTETVTFELSARAYADSDAIDQAVGTPVEVADTWLAQGDEHISAWSGNVTIAGSPAAGQFVHVEIMRDVSEDNLTGDARLKAVQIRYKQAQFGD